MFGAAVGLPSLIRSLKPRRSSVCFSQEPSSERRGAGTLPLLQVLKALSSTEGAAHAQRIRSLGSGSRGGRAQLRRSHLVRPKDLWPPQSGSTGLTMELVRTDPATGDALFRYAHTAAYREAHEAFEECVHSHDPNTLVQLLQHHPYHVDALLALSELMGYAGEPQQSADLVERALYSLELSWHPYFLGALANGCRPVPPFFHLLALSQLSSLTAPVLAGTVDLSLHAARASLAQSVIRGVSRNRKPAGRRASTGTRRRTSPSSPLSSGARHPRHINSQASPARSLSSAAALSLTLLGDSPFPAGTSR